MLTETEYLKMENPVRLDTAARILREVLPGPGYGVSKSELSEITKPLSGLNTRILESTVTSG